MRRIREIVIHCTDTPKDREVTREEIKDWHMSPPPRGRGWDRLGYHFLIHLDGNIDLLTPVEYETYGCVGHNKHAIHIALVGGKDKFGKPVFELTESQELILKTLLKQNLRQTPGVKIYGHYELDKSKTCPNFNVQTWLKENGI